MGKNYIVEIDKSITPGNSIDGIRLKGFNKKDTFSHRIRQDIKNLYKGQKCVMLGINGKSENTKIEVDHKDGRKSNVRVSDLSTQSPEDFQPLCKTANDVKRQICKKCKETDKRWSAKNIKGNPFDFYEGDESYTSELGCIGCYQYDPVEYRKTSVKKISRLAADDAVESVFKRLYPED